MLQLRQRGFSLVSVKIFQKTGDQWVGLKLLAPESSGLLELILAVNQSPNKVNQLFLDINMFDIILIIQSDMAFENRHYFIESCTFYFLSAQSKSLHQVDIFSQVVLKVFIAEKFLSDGLINIVLENLDILWRAIGYMLNEFTELLEIKTPDIILVFSHRIKDATYHELFLLIFKILENGQKS